MAGKSQVCFWVRFERLPPKGGEAVTLVALEAGDGSGLRLEADSGGGLAVKIGDSGLIAKGGKPMTFR